MCKREYTSVIFWIYYADSMWYTIQPLSFHSILHPITSILVLLELYGSIILYFWDIRYIKAREMRPLGMSLRLAFVIRILMALFFFLIWILMLRVWLICLTLTIARCIKSIICSLLVIFFNFRKYIKLAILDFVILNFQLLLLKLVLKRLKLVLNRLELYF